MSRSQARQEYRKLSELTTAQKEARKERLAMVSSASSSFRTKYVYFFFFSLLIWIAALFLTRSSSRTKYVSLCSFSLVVWIVAVFLTGSSFRSNFVDSASGVSSLCGTSVHIVVVSWCDHFVTAEKQVLLSPALV